jgi:hypothetical protein
MIMKVVKYTGDKKISNYTVVSQKLPKQWVDG